jgi:hypothetical protein
MNVQTTPPPDLQPPAPADPPAPAPEPPPAARIVVAGGKTEREIELEGRLDREGKEKVAAQVAASHAQNECDRLRSQLLTIGQVKPATKTAGTGWFETED